MYDRNLTHDEQRMVTECFNAHSNGSFRDLMKQLEGKHYMKDRWDVFKKFAEELDDFNKNDRGSLHIDNLDIHKLAMNEWQQRAKVDFYNPDVYYLEPKNEVDEERTETLNVWDGLVF